MLRAAALAAVLAVGGLAGCLSGPGGQSPISVDVVDADRAVGERGDDELWIVWLHGNETREVIEGDPARAVCDVVLSHAVHPGEERITYSNASHPDLEPGEAWGLLATNHRDSWSQCPVAYELVPDPASTRVDLGEPGELAMTVDPETADLTVNGRGVAPGEAAHVTYAYESQVTEGRFAHEGELRVEVLGAWPAENVTASR
jgi:hypothetical protein